MEAVVLNLDPLDVRIADLHYSSFIQSDKNSHLSITQYTFAEAENRIDKNAKLDIYSLNSMILCSFYWKEFYFKIESDFHLETLCRRTLA